MHVSPRRLHNADGLGLGWGLPIWKVKEIRRKIMDYEEYRREFFADPQPTPKFEFSRIGGVSLFFAEFAKALDYYTQVLGLPNYVEGEFTHGWKIGDTWLTLFPAKKGGPQNVEINFVMNTPQDAERLQQAFIDAGGEGAPPSDVLLYIPIRYCSVTDAFGTNILVYSQLAA
ncbi:MAG: hypothetical protein N2C13_02860 [Chloroflexota bacterium]